MDKCMCITESLCCTPKMNMMLSMNHTAILFQFQCFCRNSNGNSLQYSCLEKCHGRRSLVSYSPWGHKESDMTEQLHFHLYTSYLTFPCLTFLNCVKSVIILLFKIKRNHLNHLIQSLVLRIQWLGHLSK